MTLPNKNLSINLASKNHSQKKTTQSLEHKNIIKRISLALISLNMIKQTNRHGRKKRHRRLTKCRPWVSFPRPWARRLPENPLETKAWDKNDGAHMGVFLK